MPDVVSAASQVQILNGEPLVSLPQLARDTNKNPSTLFRWSVKGLRLPDGTVLRLEAIRLGARWMSSPAALARFVAATTAAFTAPPAGGTPPVRSPAERTRAAANAAKELDALGIR